MDPADLHTPPADPAVAAPAAPAPPPAPPAPRLGYADVRAFLAQLDGPAAVEFLEALGTASCPAPDPGYVLSYSRRATPAHQPVRVDPSLRALPIDADRLYAALREHGDGTYVVTLRPLAAAELKHMVSVQVAVRAVESSPTAATPPPAPMSAPPPDVVDVVAEAVHAATEPLKDRLDALASLPRESNPFTHIKEFAEAAEALGLGRPQAQAAAPSSASIASTVKELAETAALMGWRSGGGDGLGVEVVRQLGSLGTEGMKVIGELVRKMPAAAPAPKAAAPASPPLAVTPAAAVPPAAPALASVPVLPADVMDALPELSAAMDAARARGVSPRELAAYIQHSLNAAPATAPAPEAPAAATEPERPRRRMRRAA